MSIEYDSKRDSLAEVIKRATVNATYVIPDLQRPYVWSPRQVTMLIDSLYRDGVLLDSKDLLKGEIVRSMAASVASMWNRLRPSIERGADLIKERELLDNQGSFNAIIVFLAWYQLVLERLEVVSHGLTVVERDSMEKELTQRASRFLDRWVFGSQWANVWGDAAVLNFQNFATDLNSFVGRLRKSRPDDFFATVDEGARQLLGRVSDKAIAEINRVVAADRRRVHAYYPFLWVWHRLEKGRWHYSSAPMRTGRKRTSKLEVDHTVADAWWKRLVNKVVETKLSSFVGSEEERASVAPDDFESAAEAFAFINMLGNCSLLEKSFNISKSDAPMWEFLRDVHEFKEGLFGRDEWEAALSLSKTLTEPTGATLAEIKQAVQARDALIRKELVDFIAGSKHRADV